MIAAELPVLSKAFYEKNGFDAQGDKLHAAAGGLRTVPRRQDRSWQDHHLPPQPGLLGD